LKEDDCHDPTKLLSSEQLEKIICAFLEAHVGPKLPRKVIITENDEVFIAKRKINYKKWLPQILRDLFFHGKGGEDGSNMGGKQS
jgi:hypothetical protein